MYKLIDIREEREQRKKTKNKTDTKDVAKRDEQEI